MTAYLPLLATDYNSIRQELINRVKVHFPDWTDTQDSNNMLVLIEMFAGTLEQTIVYVNRQARECFLHLAQDPNNVEAHARGLGYVPQFQTPSTVQAMIRASKNLDGSSVIPAGTKFATAMDNVFYETTTSFTFPAGSASYGPVTLAQQETWPINGQGTGSANQRLSLTKTPVMPTSVDLYVNGVQWTRVDHFVDSDSQSTHFKVTVDLNGYATVLFGDGVNGQVPTQGAAFGGTYKTGGGKAGAIAPNQLGRCVSEILDSFTGLPISLSAANDTPAVPGADKETVDQIRVRAVANLKAPRALLTLEDIVTHVSQLPGIEAVKVVNWLSQPSLPHHIVQIFVAPIGAALNGTVPSPTLIASVETLVTETKPLVMGNVPQIVAPTYHTIDYSLQVGVKQGYEAVDVSSRVTARLRELFDPSVVNIWGFKPAFGQHIYESQLIMILQQVEGVRNVDILSPGDVLLQSSEYPRLGTINITTD